MLKKTNIRPYNNKIIILISIILLALSIAIDDYFINATLATLIFYLVLLISENNSVTHLMFLLGYTIYIYLPALLNGYFFETSFVLFFATSSGAIIFLYLTKNLILEKPVEGNNSYWLYFYIYSFLVILSSYLKGAAIYFVGPMVMFYALCLDGKKKPLDYIASLVFLFSFSIYYIYGWDGFGRTVVFGYLISALLSYCLRNNIKVNKILLTSIGFLGSLLMASRKNDFSGISIERSLEDSAIGPYRLAVTFIENFKERGYDFYGLADQIIFSILSFVPREVWPSKPFGFGFQYVIDNMESSFINAGHSIASTLIADHFYYIGPAGFITGILMLWFVALILKWTYRAKIFNGYIHLIFASNMMVLVWGGSTSFSARVIFPMIAIAPAIILNNLFKRKF